MFKHLVKKWLERKSRNDTKKGLRQKIRKDLDFSRTERILCLQMNAIGDAIMSQPAWATLKAHLPDGTIDLICRPHVAPLFKADGTIHSVFPSKTRPYQPWLFRDKTRLKAIINQGNYDLLIDFTALPLTAIVCADRGSPPSIGFQRRINTASKTMDLGLAYDLHLPYSETESIRHLMNTLISPWTDPKTVNLFPRIRCDDDTLRKALGLLKARGLRDGPFIVLHPGAKWPPKRWPVSHWRTLIDLLTGESPPALLLLGDKQDSKLIRRISGDFNGTHVKSLLSDEIDTSAAVIKLADLCVCNDSAAMHLSAAVGTRSIAMFGPVRPERSAPSKDEACTVFYDGMFCSPCTLYYSRNRCRRGINFCMHAIKPEWVYLEIRETIKKECSQ